MRELLSSFWEDFGIFSGKESGQHHTLALDGSATSLGVTELRAWGCSLPDPSHGDGQEPCREALPT